MSNIVYCDVIGSELKFQCHVSLHFNWHSQLTDTTDSIPIASLCSHHSGNTTDMVRITMTLREYWIKLNSLMSFETEQVCELVGCSNWFKCLLTSGAQFAFGFTDLATNVKVNKLLTRNSKMYPVTKLDMHHKSVHNLKPLRNKANSCTDEC
jgi:hypothetical protein